MSSWRDAILGEFVPSISKLTLVADPDCLLTEERLSVVLRGRGFDLIEFRDAVEFRYAYESNYRSVWDRGEHTDLVVILRLQDTELKALPYDLLKAGRKLSFNLGDLFPSLSYPVIEQLDRSLLDALHEAQRNSQPERLGDNATKDFILRHVFGLAAELIANEVELLRALLRLHYGNRRIPPTLTARFLQVLNGSDRFTSWPLTEVIADDHAFFAFLQERWPIYLSRLGTVEEAGDTPPHYGLKYPGPTHLPFGHQDIRVYIDSLFLEGKLDPVEVTDAELNEHPWVRVGIAAPGQDGHKQRASRLFDLLEKELPTAEAGHSDWIAFALKWAELSALVHCDRDGQHQARLREMGEALNTTFAAWLREHYSSLINLPPNSPAMVHHVPRRIARDFEEFGGSRAALIVVDGLSLDQWVTVRQGLHKQDSSLLIRESATFAWIPTLTSVSRQSIFAGKPPLYFPTSINSTNSEEKLWKQFWEEYGVSRHDIAYQRGLGDGDPAGVLDSAIDPGKTRVVGLVVDKIDKIMHGMQLGSAGMHNQIKQWSQGGFLCALVSQLLEHGYVVWLTADHGNIQCEGTGRPSEGVIAETRGQRVRVYPTPELRDQVAGAFPCAQEWKPVGLPPDYFPLVSAGHGAFVSPGETIVGHGGGAIEEVIVPFVKIERRPQ